MAPIDQSIIRSTIFKTIYTAAESAKPSGWSVKSKMPQISSINTSIPLMVLDVAVPITDLITFDKTSARDYTASVNFMFIVQDVSNSLEGLDEAVDAMRNMLLDSQTTFTTAGFFVTGISDESSSMEIEGNNRLLTAALSAQLKVITG